MSFHVGFTGTRSGLTPTQAATLRRVAQELAHHEDKNRWLHHGDCVGGDLAAHNEFGEQGFKVCVHPPQEGKHRAMTVGDVHMAWKPNLERNMQIVFHSDVMVACPSGPELLRSGTWATIRYARKAERPMMLILPTGSITLERWVPIPRIA
jgi:hypothetical protein